MTNHLSRLSLPIAHCPLFILHLAVHPFPRLHSSNSWRRRTLTGLLIGGLTQTQEMLDFCARHSITADVEAIPIQEVNDAYDRTVKSDVRYRFVIDLGTLKS